MQQLKPGERRTVLIALIATALSFLLTRVHVTPIALFVMSGIALAFLAGTVGQALEQVGARLGPGPTGVLQSALGNLPELFICIFSLRAGLVEVVQAALVGSILANSLLVLGLAFLVGGIRHGDMKFGKEQPRMIATLMMLAVAALIFPTLAKSLHTPVSSHIGALSIACSILLLIVFVASVPFFLKNPASDPFDCEDDAPEHAWPMPIAIGLLAFGAVGAALVSDWFVEALMPATHLLHLSPAFAGLVVVAIAGNAVENIVGIRLAANNKIELAVSAILNSSLQVALALGPALTLLSFWVSPTHHLTLVLPPLLVAALGLTTLINTMIVYDGEANWLEGVALIGLYCILAASFWWG
jgi:Ca2+:H+ antiporter